MDCGLKTSAIPMLKSLFQRTSSRGFKMPAFLAALAALVGFGGLRCSALELSTEERQLATRLTGDRGQRRDAGRMRLDPILTAVARSRAQDMATRRYFSHVNPDGLGPNALVRAAGYSLPASWNGRSENFIESIGAGYPTADAAWEGWMNSSSHRTHLLASTSFYRGQTNFGIGSYSDPASPYRRYWVIITAPPARGDDALVSRRPGRSGRVAMLAPVYSNVDPDRGEVRDAVAEVAPRPSASLQSASVAPSARLWNWKEPASAPLAPRPRATRIIGAD